jgi:cysteine desulfurase
MRFVWSNFAGIMVKLPVYLDYNATTPCDARVVETMLPYFNEKFGNAASSGHFFGWQASEAVSKAREQVAQLIGAEPNEIVFTSGATESDNLALKGVLETFSGKGNHIITCNIEHKAVLDTCKHLEKQGAEISYLKVKTDGLVDPDELKAAIKPTTVLLAIIYANNEIGTIMPMKEISGIAREKGVLVFSDATQAVGKIPVDVNNDGIDIMAFSSHKLYGPKGVGALYVRRKDPRVKLTAQIDGGGHEKGMRSGTLNVPGIVGFGKACEICREELSNHGQRIKKLRDKLENALLQIDETNLNGSKENRLPHVANIGFKYVNGDALIGGLTNIAVSSTSACSSGSMEPSHVLKAIGLNDEDANSCLRFSLGRFTTEEEIDFVIEQVKTTIKSLRKFSVLNLKK